MTEGKIKKERKKGSGGARVNAGRKAKPENERRQQLAISCTFEQKAAIVAAAEKEGITTAAYVLRACGFEKETEQEAFLNGAEFGYNKKAKEWHYVKDGDLPKEDSRPRTLGYYLTASRHKSYKGFVFEVAYFTGTIFTRDGQIGDNVVAWKEIVPPELKESE